MERNAILKKIGVLNSKRGYCVSNTVVAVDEILEG